MTAHAAAHLDAGLRLGSGVCSAAAGLLASSRPVKMFSATQPSHAF